MLRIGLTGGTGSGKSTAASRLAERGAVVVDADQLAREVVAPGTEGLEAVVGEFGPDVVTAAGELDRAALAAVAFASDERRRALESITHPLIAARTAELLGAAPSEAVLVHDVPLLVEKGMGSSYHLVVVVDAPVQDRVRRLVARGMPEGDARRRIASQASDEERLAAADVWLTNAGRTDDLHAAVDRLWVDRLLPFRDNLSAGRPAARTVRHLVGAADRARAVRRLVERIRAALGGGAEEIEVAAAEGQDEGSGPLRLRGLVRSGDADASWDEPLLRAGLAPLAEQDDAGRAYGSCDPGAPAVLRLHPA